MDYQSNQPGSPDEGYRALFDAMIHPVLLFSPWGQVRYQNQAARRVFGSDADLFVNDSGQIGGWMDDQGRLLEPERMPHLRAARDGNPVTNQLLGIRLAGEREPRWFSMDAAPEGSTGSGVLAVLMDVTESIRITQTMKETLREKDLLIREVHHRVKNNLTIISSLLNLQRDRFDSEDVEGILTALDKARTQVTCIAMAHQSALEPKTHDMVRMQEFLEGVVAQNIGDYGYTGSWRVDTGGHSISLDQAVPCGLIVNELVSNICRHSGADSLQVTVGSCHAHRLCLSVRDNRGSLDVRVLDTLTRGTEGRGSSAADGSATGPLGLGLTVVALLAGQLQGTMVWDVRPDSYTECRIEFPCGSEQE